MDKKKIYFVQVGFEFDGSVYLPYAVGTLIANCNTYDRITEAYEFSDIIFSRLRLADAVAKFDEPYMVAFSCNIWNMEYNKTLAKIVKEKYPACIILFGGHNVNEDCSLLDEATQVDMLMLGEGEQVFADLLMNLLDGRFEQTKSIAYKKDGVTIKTERSCVNDLSHYPSPFLTGVFDRILEENQGTEFLTVIETNRGCPYNCAYCDWVNGRRMRFFPMEKVLAEVEWLGTHKIGYVFCGDSNYGMFPRDVDIAKALVKTKQKYGYPQAFRVCYEKNSADRVFEICKILNSAGMDKGATLAYQTLSPAALKNIGRKNLTMEHFSALLQKYNEAGIATYSELILGLPGETKESFCRGMCRLLESGQHNSLSVYHCEMLPNSDMSDPEYIKKHGINTIKVEFNHIHSAPGENEEVQEYSYLVRSTATMSPDDWTESNLFSVCVQAFHALGFIRYFALYVHSEGYCDYYGFYSGLLKYIMNGNGKLNELWMGFKTKYDSSLAGDWNYYKPEFGNVTWFFEEGAFLEMTNERDAYINELTPYLRSFGIPDNIYDEILRYQTMVQKKPCDTNRDEYFEYDLHSYFSAILVGDYNPLVKKKTTLRLTQKKKYGSIAEYAKECVWFGRRRGATTYHADELTEVR